MDAAKSYRSVLLASIVVVGIAASCATTSPQRAQPTSPAEKTCAELWADVYEASINSDIADGESRRLADSARAECEGLGNTVPTIDTGPDVACAGDGERRNALPVSGDDKYVSVYFSCEADFATLGTLKQPLYMFSREIPQSMTDTLDHRLLAAIRTYLTGPRLVDVSRGYFSAGAAALADDLAQVSIADGTATVDFDATVEDHWGNLSTSTAGQVFLLEIQAVAFQFPEVKSLVLRVGGDCDRFWKMLEGSCQTVDRAG